MSTVDSEKLNLDELKKQKNKDINEKKEKIGDLFQISNKIYDIMNIKIAFLIFLFYIILNTDTFIENVLSKIFNNIYDSKNDAVTCKGIIISGILLSLIYIILDMLDKKDII